VFESAERLRISSATAMGAQGTRVAEPEGLATAEMALTTQAGGLGGYAEEESSTTGVSYFWRLGDTLRKIAWRYYGNPEMWDAIASANKMLDANTLASGKPLAVGDLLILPGPVSAQLPLAPTASLDEALGRDLRISVQTGDLVVTAGGTDIQTVRGPDNLAQAVRHRLLTPLGTVPTFPAYGLPVIPGQGITESFLGYAAAHINEQLLRDARIVEISKMSLQSSGDDLVMDAELVATHGANLSVVTPLSVS